MRRQIQESLIPSKREQLYDEYGMVMDQGTSIPFNKATPEYEVQMWGEDFVSDVFRQERDYFLPGLEMQPYFDEQGEPLPFAAFVAKLEAVWARLPATKHVEVIPGKTDVAEAEATVMAVITWTAAHEPKQIDAFFRLQPSPYGGWDVVQTSLLDELLVLVGD